MFVATVANTLHAKIGDNTFRPLKAAASAGINFEELLLFIYSSEIELNVRGVRGEMK